jgi:uncharacterized membrane protein
MGEIEDRGITSSMQYDRWIAEQHAKANRKKSPAQRVLHSPVTFVASVIVCALLVIALVLQVTGVI